VLTAETSALVAGGMRAPAAQQPSWVTVRVVRAVMWGGQRVEPGESLTVLPWQAAELVTAGKAERAAPVAPPVPSEPTQAAKAAPKEKTHAQR
jgi:hypothetical protein